LGFALLSEEGAIGDVSGFGSDIERAVKLTEAAIDEAEFVLAAGEHAGAEEGDKVTGEGQNDGEDCGVLQIVVERERGS
jgi:hypothetical protein